MLRGSLIRLPAKHGGSRYHNTFLRIANERANTSSRRSAQMLVDGKKAPSDQYIQGTRDFPRLRNEAALAALAAPPTQDRKAKLLAIPHRTPMLEVLAVAGEPHAVSSRLRRGGIGYHSRLHFYYRGIGRLVFQYHNGRGWLLRAPLEASALAFEDFMPYRRDPAKHGQPSDEQLALIQLLHGDALTLRLMLEARDDDSHSSIEFLDAAAQMLAEQNFGTQTLSANLVYWLCTVLSHEGGTRYANLLAEIAAHPRSPRIRNFASETIDESKHPGLAPFVRNSVSLADLRAKNPPLYGPMK